MTWPEVWAVGAEHAAQDLRSPRAHQPGEAQDLALSHLEAHVVEPRAREAKNAKRDLAACGRRSRRRVGHRPPDHQADDLALGKLRGRSGRDEPAVAQHADAIGHARDLFEAVGDEHDGDARPREAP